MKTYKLAIVNEIYRSTFQAKKREIAQQDPQLTEEELHKKAGSYFLSLPKEDERPYFRPWLAQLGLLWTDKK